MMDPDRWVEIERIFNAAQDMEPGRREEYVARECAGDECLRSEIEALLRSGTGDLMRSPALEFAARAAAEEPATEGQSSLVGRTASHYRIRELIGRVGMGKCTERKTRGSGGKIPNAAFTISPPHGSSWKSSVASLPERGCAASDRDPGLPSRQEWLSLRRPPPSSGFGFPALA